MKNEIIMLKKQALEIRKDVIEMVHNAKSGHIGGSLSCADILTVLYHHTMNLNLDEDNKRIDKFILSKGHASPAYYAVLASANFFDKKLLKGFRKVDGVLEGHPSIKIPGVDVSSGSLGQGLSIANGMALAKKIDSKPGHVYCILGDGELEEGQVWEALMSIHKFNLNNETVIVDYNTLQIDGSIEYVKKLDNLKARFESFGLNVIEINGNDIEQIIKALDYTKKSNTCDLILAHTIKGKGVSFMENNVQWHGKAVNDEEYAMAMKELNEVII